MALNGNAKLTQINLNGNVYDIADAELTSAVSSLTESVGDIVNTVVGLGDELDKKLDVSTFTEYSASTDERIEDIEDKFEGLSEDTVQEAIDKAVSAATAATQTKLDGKLDTTAFTAYSASVDTTINTISGNLNTVSGKLFTEVEYEDKTITFKDATGGTIDTLDASDFVKDGMVESVVVTGGTGDNTGTTVLKITFNTDAGKAAIEIPISSIFNADNYYTKSEVDSAIEDAIEDLDAEVSGSSDHVSVKVKEEDGVITSVTVTEDDIASASDLAELSGTVEDAIEGLDSDDGTIQGAIDKAVESGLTGYATETWVNGKVYVTGTTLVLDFTGPQASTGSNEKDD